MPRPTRLQMVGERMPHEVEAGSPIADAMAVRAASLNGSANLRDNTPSGDEGARIIAYLQEQLADREQRVQVAERVSANAEAEIEKAYTTATQAVRAAQGEAAQAQQQAKQNAGVLATIALGIAKQVAERLSWLVVFLLNRLPMLGSLAGGFLLWRESLGNATPLTLAGLGLYGLLLVLPTIWLAARTTQGDE